MRKLLAVLLPLIFCTFAVAQQALTNDSIIKMVKAGLSDDVVIATVNASPGQYTTTPDALIALKQAGVSENVISAIVNRSAVPPPPATENPVAAPSSNPDDPGAPHEAGIWVYNGSGSGPKMTELEPSVYSSGKVGGMFATAMTYGIAKTKVKAVIRSAHSNTRVTNPKAVFYFYFEIEQAGLSNASTPFGGTSTPNEYVLIRFDVKGDTRETVIGKANAFGASSGVDDKETVNFTYDKLRPGVYRVTPKEPLKPGEYGFMSPTGTGVGPYAAGALNKVFDFGVD